MHIEYILGLISFLTSVIAGFIGLLQTGLGLIVGATGPLSLTILTKELS